MTTSQLKILCIDDTVEITQILTALLTKAGFLVHSASDPRTGIAQAKELDPDLILMDIMMPGMSGYEAARALQEDAQTAKIPIVFMSTLTQPQNKVSALAAGGMDYLIKPFDKATLLETAKRYAEKKAVWSAPVPPQAANSLPAAGAGGTYRFADFKTNVISNFKLAGAAAAGVTALLPADIYKLTGILETTPARVARLLAGFAKLPYLPVINPDDIKLGVLPVKFAMQNNIAAVETPGNRTLLAISHPFNFELHEMIRNILGSDFEFGITEPSNISVLYKMTEERDLEPQRIPGTGGMVIEGTALNRLKAAAKSVKNEINEPHVKYLTGKLLQFLAEERTAAARLEAGVDGYLVRTGAGSDLKEFTRFNRMTGNLVVARLKALGGLDILERNKRQTGAFSVLSPSENIKLSLSAEPNDYGESLVLTPAA